MPPYNSEKLERHIDLKFLRIRRDIFIGSRLDNHMDIADADDLNEIIDNVRVEDAKEVDGGILLVSNKTLYLFGDSTSLQLPVHFAKEDARKISLADFKIQSPGFRVLLRK